MIINKIKIGTTTYDVGVNYNNVDNKPDLVSQLELILNSENYKLKGVLKDENGNIIYTSNEIDLPLESVVINGSYDSQTKEVVLTLVNGSTIRFSVADLVSGLVSSTDLATALANYYTKNEVNGLLANKQNTIQYSIMPTADSTTVGKIVQYTGTTDSTYTNGYFYIGTTDGQSTPTYSWENINVQASGGGSFGFITNSITSSTTASNLNIVDYLNGAGVYKFFGSGSMEIYGLNGGNGTRKYSYHVYGNTFYMIKDYATANNGDYLGFCFTSDDNDSTNIGMLFTAIWKANDGNGVFYSRDNNIKLDLVLKYGNQYISGKKTFTTLPESSVTPTNDNQLTRKGYVDSAIASAITTALESEY